MNVSLRPAQPEDIAAIARIYAEAVTHGTASFEIEPPSYEEMQRRRQTLLAGGYPYVVAVIDGQVAGYAYAGPYRARPAYHWSVEDSVYVDPRAQRQGIGRLLLDRIVDDAQTTGFRQMIAVIGDSAQTPSIELHRAAGFRLIGTIENVGFKLGHWLDTVLMQRALGEGAASAPGMPPLQGAG